MSAVADRGDKLGSVRISVDVFADGSAVITVGRSKQLKRHLKPPTVLLAAVEAYANKVVFQKPRKKAKKVKP